LTATDFKQAQTENGVGVSEHRSPQPAPLGVLLHGCRCPSYFGRI